MEPLPYLTERDTYRRMRVLMFVALWVAYGILLGWVGLDAWLAKLSIDKSATTIWFSRRADAHEVALALLWVGLQLVARAWALFRARWVRGKHAEQVTRTYTFWIFSNWVASALGATSCFSICERSGEWGLPGVCGFLSGVMILMSIPRLSRLWPVTQPVRP